MNDELHNLVASIIMTLIILSASITMFVISRNEYTKARVIDERGITYYENLPGYAQPLYTLGFMGILLTSGALIIGVIGLTYKYIANKK